jgi:uncharacterized protein (DUF924 family)
MADDAIAPLEVLAFWFSPEVKAKWFEPDDAFDAELRRRFEPALKQARSGALDSWGDSPQGALALIVLLDQISRNIYRGTPQAFAADALALGIARRAVARGFDKNLATDERAILYMPFMHSERLEDQEEGVKLFTALGLDVPLDFMRRHRDIIARFGRFPHRNAILGRPSTPEELEFLKQPGSSF